MNTAIETNKTFTMVPLDRIVSRLPVRRLSTRGVARIMDSMQRSGFLENYPLIVVRLADGTYLLVDGNHRYEAAAALGLDVVPCVVRDEMPEGELYKLALESNDAAETVVPATLVTHAEFIWQRVQEGHTQEEIAKMMGWERGKIAKYVMLKNLSEEAWNCIVPTFEDIETSGNDDEGTKNVPRGTIFTERLLRDILPLSSEQQLELVQALAESDEKKRITKGKFKTQAENYKARNEMRDYATDRLGDLGEEFTTRLLVEIYSGAYDAEWKADKEHLKHPKLDRLIQSIHDEWEDKNSMHPLYGDFYEQVKKVGDGSVDLILTDPPYNIANGRVFSLAGRSNRSQDFGAWDKYHRADFIDLFPVWAQEWARILRDGGSGYVFVSYLYVSYLAAALEEAGLHVREMIDWCKTNPGPQIEHVTFRSSVEHILYFTKGKDHTFHWQGENDMQTYYIAPICLGNERLKDAKGDTLHPTQKPEQVIEHLMSISSNRGDMVFDGFMGVGTTGAVAKRLGRKFIGIEQDKTFFEAAQRRIA